MSPKELGNKFLAERDRLLKESVSSRDYLILCQLAVALARAYPKYRSSIAIDLVSVASGLDENDENYKLVRSIGDDAIDLEWDVPDGKVDRTNGLSAIQKWDALNSRIDEALANLRSLN